MDIPEPHLSTGMSAHQAAAVSRRCHALSTAMRIRIVTLLGERGVRTLQECAQVLGEPKGSIDYSINVLLDAGLIEITRRQPQGTKRFFGITPLGEHLRIHLAPFAIEVDDASTDGNTSEARSEPSRPRTRNRADPDLPSGVAVPKPPSRAPEWFRNAWLALPRRERVVLALRSGLNAEPLTLSEIGDLLHRSVETIRQLEFHALGDLAAAMPEPAFVPTSAHGRQILANWLPERRPRPSRRPGHAS